MKVVKGVGRFEMGFVLFGVVEWVLGGGGVCLVDKGCL